MTFKFAGWGKFAVTHWIFICMTFLRQTQMLAVKLHASRYLPCALYFLVDHVECKQVSGYLDACWLQRSLSPSSLSSVYPHQSSFLHFFTLLFSFYFCPPRSHYSRSSFLFFRPLILFLHPVFLSSALINEYHIRSLFNSSFLFAFLFLSRTVIRLQMFLLLALLHSR